MCLVIAGVFSYLAYSFYELGEFMNALVNGVVALFFLALLLRNILKTKRERSK